MVLRRRRGQRNCVSFYLRLIRTFLKAHHHRSHETLSRSLPTLPCTALRLLLDYGDNLPHTNSELERLDPEFEYHQPPGDVELIS